MVLFCPKLWTVETIKNERGEGCGPTLYGVINQNIPDMNTARVPSRLSSHPLQTADDHDVSLCFCREQSILKNCPANVNMSWHRRTVTETVFGVKLFLSRYNFWLMSKPASVWTRRGEGELDAPFSGDLWRRWIISHATLLHRWAGWKIKARKLNINLWLVSWHQREITCKTLPEAWDPPDQHPLPLTD